MTDDAVVQLLAGEEYSHKEPPATSDRASGCLLAHQTLLSLSKLLQLACARIAAKAIPWAGEAVPLPSVSPSCHLHVCALKLGMQDFNTIIYRYIFTEGVFF